MTPERKKEIMHKLRCADIWDKSKMEFHTMLSEAMAYIEKLEDARNAKPVGPGLHTIKSKSIFK